MYRKYVTLENNSYSSTVDCWDGPNGEPVVYHGWTLTSKMSLVDALESIRKNGFSHTDTPLILSLEIHCNPEQQKKIAQHLNDALGDLIYRPNVKSDESDLPSLSSSRGRVFLQGELAKLDKKIRQVEVDIASQLYELDEFHNDLNPPMLPTFLEHYQEEAERKIAETIDESIQKMDETFPSLQPEKDTIGQWASELYDLMFFKSVRDVDSEYPNEMSPLHKMLNLSEGMGLTHIFNKGKEFTGHNEKLMTRIYPKATRVFSTNFDPQIFWRAGCQIVSLNFQFCDQYLRLNNGFFASSEGYLHKEILSRQIDTSAFQVEILDYVPAALPLDKFRFPIGAIEASSIHNSKFKIHIIELLKKKKSHGNADNTITLDTHNQATSAVSFGVFQKKEALVRPLSRLVRLGNVECLGYTALPLHLVRPGYRFIPIHSLRQCGQDEPCGTLLGGYLVRIIPR